MVELNLTLACNHKCPSCDRLCNRFPTRECHMTLDQIDKLCKQASESKGIKRLKVVGGEPFMHPEYREVNSRLVDALEAGSIQRVKIQSNGILPKPKDLKTHPNMWFAGKPFRKRQHLPIWSPSDHNQQWSIGCMTLKKCGFSLDTYGWLPCSPAIAIVGAFGLEHLYRDEMPTKPWGLNELCQHCVYAGPEKWKKANLKSFAKMTDEHRELSSSWESKLLEWNGIPRKERW